MEGFEEICCLFLQSLIGNKTRAIKLSTLSSKKKHNCWVKGVPGPKIWSTVPPGQKVASRELKCEETTPANISWKVPFFWESIYH